MDHCLMLKMNILNPFYYRHNLHIIPQPASLYCINPDNYSQANVSFSALHIQFFNDDPCYYFVVAVQRWLMTVCRCRYGIQIPSTRLHSVGQLVAIVLRSFNFFLADVVLKLSIIQITFDVAYSRRRIPMASYSYKNPLIYWL